MVLISVKETLRWDVNNLLATIGLQEGEGQGWYFVSEDVAVIDEVAPFQVFASESIFRVGLLHILLEYLKSIFGHTNERETWINEGACIFEKGVAMEADIEHLGFPAGCVDSLEPDLFVALSKEILVVPAKANLGGVLRRVPQVSVHAELRLADHVLSSHGFKGWRGQAKVAVAELIVPRVSGLDGVDRVLVSASGSRGVEADVGHPVVARELRLVAVHHVEKFEGLVRHFAFEGHRYIRSPLLIMHRLAIGAVGVRKKKVVTAGIWDDP